MLNKINYLHLATLYVLLIAQDMTRKNISIYLIFHIVQLLGNCVLLRGGGSLKIECIVIVELCSKHVEWFLHSCSVAAVRIVLVNFLFHNIRRKKVIFICPIYRNFVSTLAIHSNFILSYNFIYNVKILSVMHI